MKKLVVLPATAVGVLAAAGIAWAALGGTIVVPDTVIGLATGQGSSSCQTGALTFTLPDPTWNATIGEYAITTVDFSGVSTPCVNLGTADLQLTITMQGSSTALASSTASNLSSSSGTLTLSQAVPFDTANTADYNYLLTNG